MTSAAPSAKLYVILGSHACRTGMLLLEHKGIALRRVTVRTGTQRLMPLYGFEGGTVPALAIDGRRVQTNRAIARFLDELRPEPPLFPADPGRRRAVEEAEQWGDDVFQMAARRLILAATMHGADAVVDAATTARSARCSGGYTRDRERRAPLVGRFVFDVNPRTERKLLDDLPAQLDRIDAWVDAGVLGGERLYAADYMLATSCCLLTYRRDLLPETRAAPGVRLGTAGRGRPTRSSG